MKKGIIALGLILVCLTAFASSEEDFVPELKSMKLYGSVSANGDLAPRGLIVQAFIGNTTVGQHTMQRPGEYRLAVFYIEEAPVKVYVDGVYTGQEVAFKADTELALNLSITNLERDYLTLEESAKQRTREKLLEMLNASVNETATTLREETTTTLEPSTTTTLAEEGEGVWNYLLIGLVVALGILLAGGYLKYMEKQEKK